MIELLFATNNQHKAEEFQAAIGEKIKIITLKEAGIDIDIPEIHETLEGNAAEKSQNVYRLTGKDCFSDDTGLEVEALNGEPGVKSARYAGEAKAFEKNIEKLLVNLGTISNRKARFKTVISLLLNGKEFFFEGICRGNIATEPRGTHGFGYDSIFIPESSSKTMAEMTQKEKERYSHRKIAADKLVLFLQRQNTLRLHQAYPITKND